MINKKLSRRDWIVSAASAAAATTVLPRAASAAAAPSALAAFAAMQQDKIPAQPEDSTRERRMKWWHEARFGMFIHWGLYSVLGRHEWVMENEGIPVEEYEHRHEI